MPDEDTTPLCQTDLIFCLDLQLFNCHGNVLNDLNAWSFVQSLSALEPGWLRTLRSVINDLCKRSNAQRACVWAYDKYRQTEWKSDMACRHGAHRHPGVCRREEDWHLFFPTDRLSSLQPAWATAVWRRFVLVPLSHALEIDIFSNVAP